MHSESHKDKAPEALLTEVLLIQVKVFVQTLNECQLHKSLIAYTKFILHKESLSYDRILDRCSRANRDETAEYGK